MRKTIFSYLFLLLSLSVLGQDKYNYRYWFDVNDRKCVLGTSQSNVWNIDVDVSELDDALHSFNIQVQDSVGMWSSPISKYFYKKYTSDYSVKYWFDGDLTTAKDINEIGTTSIDVSHLKDGFHTIQSVVKSKGALSNVETRYFIKIPQTVGVDYMTCFCYIDDKAYLQERVSANGGVLNWTFDVESLSHGLHRVQVFLVTPSGAMSSTADGFFLRVPTENELTTLKCYYIIDGSDNDGSENKFIQAGTYSDGIYHFDLDVSSLTDGLHKLTYMLVGTDGMVTSSKTSLFYKRPLGGNGISKWEYWVNGNDSLKHINIPEEPKKSFELISLLPVESYPIRSSCYEFRVKENKPILYAKNDIRFLFYDKAGCVIDVSKQYVDESVRQELMVDEIAVLKSNVVTRVNRPAENEIKWYKFDAEEGDSMVVNVDKACSIDVFSPSGKSVYSAMGAESVKASGTHLYEAGTFYVAIHDMTAKYGDEINLNFQLIDKYAVLSQNVHKVGNGGISTITFNGNGYLYLDSISISKNNTIIKDFDIKYKSNTEIEATFNFNGAEIGGYDIILHFVDEDLVLTNGLMIETAKDITLTSKVSYDTQFLRGTSSEYSVTLTNHGNMTAYKVPIYVYVETPLSGGIPVIKMNGFDGVLDGVDLSEFSQREIDELQSLVAEIGDGLHFNKFRTINEETGDSIMVQSNYFFVELSPYSTNSYTISVDSEQLVSCYVTTPEEWFALGETDYIAKPTMISTKNVVKDYFCCYHDRVECIANIVTYGADITSMIATLVPGGAGVAATAEITSCVSASISSISSSVSEIFCSEQTSWGEKNLYEKLQAVSSSISVASFVKNCFLRYVKKIENVQDSWEWLNKLSTINDFSFGKVDTSISCYSAFFSKKPNCPPTPPQGGTSTPVNSLDPNDIHGYVAESGSKYIGKDVKTINYMIEFENDSTFATSSAHKILLVDTLDVDVLDVTSVVPKSMKIGKHDCDFTKKASGYVATIDMRSEINAIAQISVNVTDKGVMNCEIISLDPMTMEPTDDIMAGILPVNDASGRGQGMLTFMVNLKSGLKDGIEISNKADIIFDSNEPISTPYWINETDYVNPVSKIGGIENVSDTTINIYISGEDERSGIWRYTLYVQPGDGSDWFLAKENIEADTCEYKVYPDINYGFCVVATDKAGNIEEKQLVRGYSYCNGVATSGLQDINLDNSDDKANDETMYDLLGRKVKNPSQGLFVKKKQKVLIK